MSNFISFLWVISLILTFFASKQIGFSKRYFAYYADIFKDRSVPDEWPFNEHEIKSMTDWSWLQMVLCIVMFIVAIKDVAKIFEGLIFICVIALLLASLTALAIFIGYNWGRSSCKSEVMHACNRFRLPFPDK